MIVAQNDTQYGCYGDVDVYGYNFQPGATVRIELLSGDQQTVMDTIYTTATGLGGVQYGITPFVMHLSPGYHGPVWVVADEYYPYGQTTWAGLSSVC